MVFGMWVERVSAGQGRLFVDDGTLVTSQMTAGPAGWSWLEMSHTVSPLAQSLACGFIAEGSGGAAWRIAEPRLDFGERRGVGADIRPMGRLERFVVKITPDSFFGANFTFGDHGAVLVDIAGETTMSIAEDVPIIYVASWKARPMSADGRCSPAAASTRRSAMAPRSTRPWRLSRPRPPRPSTSMTTARCGSIRRPARPGAWFPLISTKPCCGDAASSFGAAAASSVVPGARPIAGSRKRPVGRSGAAIPFQPVAAPPPSPSGPGARHESRPIRRRGPRPGGCRHRQAQSRSRGRC